MRYQAGLPSTVCCCLNYSQLLLLAGRLALLWSQKLENVSRTCKKVIKHLLLSAQEDPQLAPKWMLTVRPNRCRNQSREHPEGNQ